MIAWVDLETTGLDARLERVLEVGLVLTDDRLNVMSRTSTLIHQQPGWETRLIPLVREMHEKSGLIQAIYEAGADAPLKVDAESLLLGWLFDQMEAYGFTNGELPLGGSSVHFDRGFMELYFPALYRQFHYRSIDVSTVKELCRRWYPDIFKMAPAKQERHRVIPDLDDTLAELRFYEDWMFVGGESSNK